MVKSADDEPHITLERWGVMQDICGYRLVGVAAGTSAGRVSSPVITYYGHAMTADHERTHVSLARRSRSGGYRRNHQGPHRKVGPAT